MKIETLFEIRRDRLKAHISENHKSTADFCRTYGFDENRVRHLLTGIKNFGEKAARQMEEDCGLSDFYFDTDKDISSSTIVLMMQDLDERDKQEVFRHLELLQRDNKKKKAST